MSKPRGKYTTRQCPRCGAIGPVVDPCWLRAERQDAEVTLREMARRLGVSAAYLSDVERGRRSALPRIVAAYECVAGRSKDATAGAYEDDDPSSVPEGTRVDAARAKDAEAHAAELAAKDAEIARLRDQVEQDAHLRSVVELYRSDPMAMADAIVRLREDVGVLRATQD